jgi:AcrR family transcriptional regulator
MSRAPAARKRLPAARRREVIEDAASGVFAERGFHGAAVGEIARRAGVTVPVLYDHFRSKQDLYQQLIERHYAALRSIWFAHASSGQPLSIWLGPAVGEWFAYVEAHPFAGRMLFRDTTGDPALEAVHRGIQDGSRGQLLPLLAAEAARGGVDLGDRLGLELAWETIRAVLQGLALWWYEHPDVPRARIVSTAMNAMWIGLERHLAGDSWPPST